MLLPERVKVPDPCLTSEIAATALLITPEKDEFAEDPNVIVAGEIVRLTSVSKAKICVADNGLAYSKTTPISPSVRESATQLLLPMKFELRAILVGTVLVPVIIEPPEVPLT